MEDHELMVAHDVGSEDWMDEKQQAQIADGGSSKDHRWKGLLSIEHMEVGGAFQQGSKPAGKGKVSDIGSENQEP